MSSKPSGSKIVRPRKPSNPGISQQELVRNLAQKRPRIVSIGDTFTTDVIETIGYRDSQSLLDYEAVIWDPNSLLDEYFADYDNSQYMGAKLLRDSDSAKIYEDLVRRKSEIIEMLKLGRSIVIFTPSPTRFYVATGEKKVAGRTVTRIVTERNVLEAIPVDGLSTVAAEGSMIGLVAREPYKKFWAAMKDYLRYEAYFEKPVGESLMFIKGTTKPVGAWLPAFNGNILFLPCFVMPESLAYKELRKVEDSCISSLLTLIEDLKASSGDFLLPPWSAQYYLPGEKAQDKVIKAVEGQISELIQRRDKKKDETARLQNYKLLFTGTGKALEVVVAGVLRELGFEVQEPPPGRDDLIIKYADKVAVVEVKGKTKSAAEKDGAQLEKWVSAYYEKHGVIPKGILIVNAFNETPLHQRTELAFPDQMLGYSKGRNHCLITGIQLLGLYLACKNDPESRQRLIDSLFSTAGVFDDFQMWTSFIDLRLGTVTGTETPNPDKPSMRARPKYGSPSLDTTHCVTRSDSDCSQLPMTSASNCS
jgi:hypothetical protein